MKVKRQECSTHLGSLCRTGIEARLTRIGWGNMQMGGQNVSNCVGSFGSEECQGFRRLREGGGS